jgi:DNA-directed RNA polymerase sigma subunit (sigma70/sigma32)
LQVAYWFELLQEAISQEVKQPLDMVQMVLLAGLPIPNLDDHWDDTKQEQDFLQSLITGKVPCERSLREIHKRMDALLRTLEPRERNILRLRCVASLASQPYLPS